MKFCGCSGSRVLLQRFDEPGVGCPDDTYLWSASIAAALPREVTLDCVLSALRQDWPPSHATWYVGLHDRLAPTVEELASRQDAYRALLSAAASRTVAVGQRALKSLLAVGRLEADAFLDVADAPLHRPEKSRALAQISLLATLGSAHPGLACACAQRVSAAVGHPLPAVQEAAAKSLLGLNAAAARQEQPGVPGDPAEMGDRAAEILGLGTSAQGPIVPVPGPRRAPLPRAAPALGRIGLADAELALVHLMEEADDPMLLEQALEAVALHANQRPASAALVRQAEQRAAEYLPYTGLDVRRDLAQLVVSWATGRPPEAGLRPVHVWLGNVPLDSSVDPGRPAILHMGLIVSARLRELALLAAAGRPRMLLATPTSQDGTLNAASLRGRLASISPRDEPLTVDTELAALRAGPDAIAELESPPQHRTAARLAKASGELQRALSWERAVGASLRDKLGFEAIPPVVVWQDPTSAVGDMDRVIASLFDLTDPLGWAVHRWQDGLYTSHHDQMVALWPFLAPHHTDLIMAQAHPQLCRGLSKDRCDAEPLLRALARVTAPPGEPALSALSLGLCGKSPSLRIAAVDAFVGLTARNLLDGTALGRISAQHAHDKIIVVSRLLGSLQSAARSNGACAWRAMDTLESMLPGLAGMRDLGAALELTDELSRLCGRAPHTPGGLSATGAVGKAAARLRARGDAATPARAEAAHLLAP